MIGAYDPTMTISESESIDLTDNRPRNRPTFTITDAASACGVSRKTITRKLADLGEHGAAKDDDGIWRIPVEALLAIGMHPGRSLTVSSHPAKQLTRDVPAGAPLPRPAEQPQVQAPDVVNVPRAHWDDLRIRLARAEAQASERSLALADARLALRALTAGPTVAPATMVPAAASSVPPIHDKTAPLPDESSSVRKRRWWHAA